MARHRSNIIIVGGGLVGQTLAERLSRDDHDVTLIESDPEKVPGLSDGLDVQVIEGNGSTAATLRGAGADKADLLIASTDSDEVNVVAGHLATHLFQVPRVVVRLHDPAHEEGFALIAAKGVGETVTVNPDRASVDRIVMLLEVPGAIDVLSFLGGELLVAGFHIPANSDLAGLHVSDMQLLFASTPTLAAAIRRGKEWLIPHGDESICAGDLVYFSIARSELSHVLSLVGVAQDRGRRVMIAGTSPMALDLARRLRSRDFLVVLLEENAVLAQRAAEALEDVLVIHGRLTDHSLLEDEEIEKVANFVALSDDHESNLVSALLAKRLGAGRSFALVDNPALVAMAGDIEVDAIISPRSVTIGLTLEHIRGEDVRAGAALLEDEVEIMEIEAARASRICAGPLRDANLPRGILVAAIKRGAELRVPRGDDRVQPGDRVVLISHSDRAQKLTAYLNE